MATEEERLERLMNKKSEQAFEAKRREALAKYSAQTGKQFELAEKEEPKKKSFVVSTPTPTPTPTASTSSPTTSNWREEHERKLREEKREEEEEAKRKEKVMSELGKDAHDNLSDWKTKQEQEEKEFKRRREEEERKKQEGIEKNETRKT